MFRIVGTVLIIVLWLYRSHWICSTCWWDLFKPWWSLLSSGTRSAPHVWPVWQPWPSWCRYRPVLESSSASSGRETALLWSLMYMFPNMTNRIVFIHIFILCRSKTAVLTDNRIRIMNEVVSGIRIIKMYTWEKPFSALVTEVRRLG